jgi:broad specificity phosphatase PhoE
VLLLRHGEKLDGPDRDPPLSEAGRARAQLLVHMLGQSGVTAIVTTHLQRTQQTAQPLARHLGLPLQVVQASDIDATVAQILTNAGGVVLVVGHSDSVVTLLGRLGAGPVPPIGHDEYDNLYVVTLDGHGGVRLAFLQYGAPT